MKIGSTCARTTCVSGSLVTGGTWTLGQLVHGQHELQGHLLHGQHEHWVKLLHGTVVQGRVKVVSQWVSQSASIFGPSFYWWLHYSKCCGFRRIHVFGPPESGSVSQRYRSGSFYHQAKIERKPWFILFCDFLSFNLQKVKSRKILRKKNCVLFSSWRSMPKIGGSGSISQRCWSGSVPKCHGCCNSSFDNRC